MTAPACGTCRFFLVENASARMGTLALYAETSGECRRFPPLLPGSAGHVAPSRPLLPTAQWPFLPASAWCGEFVAHAAVEPSSPTNRPDSFTGADR